MKNSIKLILKNMKILKYKLFLLLILASFYSCVEEGESVNFIILNETDVSIVVIQYGYNYIVDTVLLDIEDEIMQHYSEATGGVSRSPFRDLDSLIFVKNDSINKSYSRISSGKSPFNLDYYEGDKKGYNNHITSYEYIYRIKNEDFEISNKTHIP